GGGGGGGGAGIAGSAGSAVGAGGASAQRLARSAPGLPAQLRAIAQATAARLAPRLPGGRVYTDDVAPVEWLVDTSIVQVAADGER
ncbi:MAG: hypothetical protein ACR2H2_15395, partial [Solirubrobacteraceae bacterium]